MTEVLVEKGQGLADTEGRRVKTEAGGRRVKTG